MRFLLALAMCLTVIVAAGDFAVSAQEATHTLTNQDIERMKRVNFDDTTIIKTIQSFDSSFDLSVDALVKLKELGVSQTVIQAMLAAKSGKKSSNSQASPEIAATQILESAKSLDEVGVYQVVKGKLVAVEPEIVNWRTGGVIKNAVTLGLDKGHVNGTVAGPTSAVTLASTPLGMGGPIQFYIRCLEGNSASEYQLLRFWQKGDRREFRSVTGGVLHMSGGADNNVVAFKFEKIAPRTYKVTLPAVSIGEYGFLAPGAAASADMASRGKIYTFRIAE